MDLRPLGRTDLHVAPIALGTVKLGRTTGLKYPGPVRLPTDDEALALLHTARELGVNLIDTAAAYGTAEERLGHLLPKVAPRGHWIIATKCGEHFDPDAAGGRSTYDFSPAALRASVEQSLRRLRVDAIDLVFLHFSGSVTDQAQILRRGDAVGALRELRTRGLVRFLGASTAGPEAGLAALAAGLDAVMVTLNHVEHSERPVITAAAAAGVGVFIKKPLASGHLPPGQGAAAALAAVLKTPGVTAAVLGTTNPEHLRVAVARA